MPEVQDLLNLWYIMSTANSHPWVHGSQHLFCTRLPAEVPAWFEHPVNFFVCRFLPERFLPCSSWDFSAFCPLLRRLLSLEVASFKSVRRRPISWSLYQLTVDQYSLGLFVPDLQDHLVGLALCCRLRERDVRFGLLRFPFWFRDLWMIGRMIGITCLRGHLCGTSNSLRDPYDWLEGLF